MSICGTGRIRTIGTSLLLDADAAAPPAIGADLEPCLIGAGGWCLGIGTEGQFLGDFAAPLANGAPRYYFHCRLLAPLYGTV